MKFFKNKKGASLQSLYPSIMAFIMVAILLGIGLVVLNAFMSTTSVSGTTAETAINDTINALADFPDWFPIIVVVIAAAIIIGIVIRGFSGGNRL